MIAPLHPPLRALHSAVLWIVIVVRISTEHQDERSLKDQEAKVRRYIEDHYDGPVQYKVISSRGSGEHLDRKELTELEDLIESDKIDVVIAEDLARICRRKRAIDFCELCQDHNVRLIAINDRVDTAQPGWEDGAFLSTWHHERSNRDTSDRIKRTLRNRFLQGGIIQFEIFGYIKPEGAKSDADLRKDPAAEAIYDKWFSMLEAGASYCEVADWLNALGIRPGPFSRRQTWTGAMVKRVTFNPILKGVRQRNRRKSQRVNKTGRHRSVLAEPHELLERECPHLAFIELARYDRLIRDLIARNAKYVRGKNGRDPRRNAPRKRTRWPGQHLYCGICGRMYVYGGHGQVEHLVCRGAKEYRCWNTVTVEGPLAARKLATAVVAEIEQIPEFDPLFLEQLQRELDELSSGRMERLGEIERKGAELQRRLDNVTLAIAERGHSGALLAQLQKLEEDFGILQDERADLLACPDSMVGLPPLDEIRRLAHEKLAGLLENSQDAARQIRELVPKIRVYPHRLIDGGHIVQRARFRLNLAPLVSGLHGLDGYAGLVSRDLQVDLFVPPQRELIRRRLIELRAGGMTERLAARELGVTITACAKSAALQRLMEQQGLSDPYLPVTEPPKDYGKIRTHRHPRYRFDPLPPEPDSL